MRESLPGSRFRNARVSESSSNNGKARESFPRFHAVSARSASKGGDSSVLPLLALRAHA
jgi:hypothetical protein